MRAQANKHQNSNIIVVVVDTHKPKKNNTIRKFKPKSSSNNFMCTVGNNRRICMVGTRTIIGTTMMNGLQQRREFTAVGVINSMLGGQNSQLIDW